MGRWMLVFDAKKKARRDDGPWVTALEVLLASATPKRAHPPTREAVVMRVLADDIS